jgi:HAD superfamily hydrolase (TIGR01490 family)
MSSTEQKVAAFFDLDRTLLSVNSGAMWVKRERRLGRLTTWQYQRALLYLLAYRLSLLDMDTAMRHALKTVKGKREKVIRQRTRDWYFGEVAGRVTPGARRALADHRGRGHHLALLSTTSPYEAEAVVEHLDLHGAIFTGYEVREGVFTGEPLLPICYGEGKVELAEQYARDHNISLERSYFYTDSATDLPMLRRIGNPRVVNPDLLLRMHALRNGWSVLDWR